MRGEGFFALRVFRHCEYFQTERGAFSKNTSNETVNPPSLTGPYSFNRRGGPRRVLPPALRRSRGTRGRPEAEIVNCGSRVQGLGFRVFSELVLQAGACLCATLVGFGCSELWGNWTLFLFVVCLCVVATCFRMLVAQQCRGCRANRIGCPISAGPINKIKAFCLQRNCRMPR